MVCIPNIVKPMQQSLAPNKSVVARLLQGILNLTSVQPDSATLMVKDKSYHAHHDFWEQSSMLEADKQKQGDFYRFQPDEMPYWDSYETVAVRGGPGSLFIWDSRTVHMNQPATADGIWR